MCIASSAAAASVAQDRARRLPEPGAGMRTSVHTQLSSSSDLAVVVLDVDRGAHAIRAARQPRDVDPLEDEVPRVGDRPSPRTPRPGWSGRPACRTIPARSSPIAARAAAIGFHGVVSKKQKPVLAPRRVALRIAERPGLVGHDVLHMPVVVAVAGVLSRTPAYCAESGCRPRGTAPGRSPWSCRCVDAPRATQLEGPGPSVDEDGGEAEQAPAVDALDVPIVHAQHLQIWSQRLRGRSRGHSLWWGDQPWWPPVPG